MDCLTSDLGTNAFVFEIVQIALRYISSIVVTNFKSDSLMFRCFANQDEQKCFFYGGGTFNVTL